MSLRRLALAPAVLLGAAALVLPAAASARTYTVHVGAFGKLPHTKVPADGNAFFRKSITIHKGDRIRWRWSSTGNIHTVTFAPKGAPVPGFVVPTGTVSGVNDAAGQPFWFDGVAPNFQFNPKAVAPQGGHTVSAHKLVGSGIRSGGSYTLRFPHTGTFNYVCVVHDGMGGKVRVVSRRHHVPSERTDTRVAKRQLRHVINQVRHLQTGVGTPKGDVIQAGDDRRDGATVYAFFPAVKTIKAGTILTLQMAPGSVENHTFTFGPAKYLAPIEGSFEKPPLDPRGFYASDSPQAPIPNYDGTNHGNGFYNSGILGRPKNHSGLPSAVKVRFTKAGTYNYVCAIHPFMRGTIKVLP